MEVIRVSCWKSCQQQVEGTLRYRLVRVVLEVMWESCWKSCLEQVEGTLQYRLVNVAVSAWLHQSTSLSVHTRHHKILQFFHFPDDAVLDF